MSKITELVFPNSPELVDLPSRGKYYSLEHPLHEQSCVEIIQMRAIEEDILTNKDLLRRELAIDKLVQSILIDERVKNEKNFLQLLVADQAAIVLKARISAYTWEYPVSITCPKCAETVKFKFDLRKSSAQNVVFQEDENVKYLEESNTFSITIPDTQINVIVRPATIGTQRKIKNKVLNKKKKELTNKEQLEDLIVSINGSSDVRIIDEFFKQIPAFYLSWFKAVLQDINPRLSLLQEFTCENCGHIEDMEPPFTTDFLFTPKMKRGMKESGTSSDSE